MKKYKLKNPQRFYSVIMISVLVVSLGLIFKEQGVQGESIKKYEIVTVQYGDTIWDLAEKYNKDNDDLRMFVYQIKKENKIFGDYISPDEQLRIPIG